MPSPGPHARGIVERPSQRVPRERRVDCEPLSFEFDREVAVEVDEPVWRDRLRDVLT
jgi:hypothetical protein